MIEERIPLQLLHRPFVQRQEHLEPPGIIAFCLRGAFMLGKHDDETIEVELARPHPFAALTDPRSPLESTNVLLAPGAEPKAQLRACASRNTDLAHAGY